MKITIASVLLLAASASAFAPAMNRNINIPSTTSTRLFVERGNSSDAIQDAIEASKRYGPTSQQARVAWDIVEEINASDNSAAYNSNDHDALSDPSQNKEKYEQFLELKGLLENQRQYIDSVKHVTTQIRAVKIADPSRKHSDEPKEQNPILESAINEAKLMTSKYGVESSEAKLAWETVENIASNDLSEAMKASVDDDGECLIEMIEACEALDELNRALFLDSKKEAGRYQG
eukprot:CAMPEP_0204618520 /NCGR_PEP_ID=MMETSP0717-20131115/5129_1 /ASSEMBLY_ACC=CAM_ASM_000666 /TAXON_ID=230516 /ORGANISM="Chaetoceros curvisetus" /LENGTH=232 /DNA_ID=CAMNT_0051632277 /DNA_START=39 /DNA_END=740 /DNA_ORIENTATION=-